MPSTGQPEDTAEVDAYYVSLGGGRYRSTRHAQGAWGHDQQHMGPVSGLLVHALERFQPRDDLALARVAFDIMGVIPAGDVEVRTRMLRGGRTIELLEADLVGGDRTLVRAAAWRLARSDTSSVAGVEADPMPGTDAGQPWKGSETWPGGFIESLEFRVLPGWRPGRGRVWVHSTVDLVAGEQTSDLACFFALVDTSNGVAVRVDPSRLLFPNTDLTVHLFREPAGRWVGLDTAVTFGGEGVGLTTSTLHDMSGPVGRSEQVLTIRSLPH